MIIKPAKRIKNISEYYFSIKFKQIKKMESKGLKIINLGMGNPDLLPPNKVIKKIKKSVKLYNANKYQSYIGIKKLRNEISNWYFKNYNVILDPNKEILPLMGSKEGIMHISMAYLNKNEKVLIPDPGYPTYTSISKLIGGKIIKYKLKEKNNWQIDFKLLKKNLPGTKILWINYPNMPTGALADIKKIKKLIDIAKKYKILIVNDNPYSLILNPNPNSIFQIKEAKEVALELNSLSKSHNMAGWRIGMIIGKNNFIKNILKVKSQMDSGMYLPIQLGAIEALKQSKKWIKKQNKIYYKRKKIIENICDKIKLSYNKKSAGIFVWAKLPNKKNDIKWTEKILNKKHIFITPGSIFGKNGKGYVRFSLCNSIENLKEAKKRMTKKKLFKTLKKK